MNDTTKKAIQKLVDQAVKAAGSQNKFAARHKVSGATVSNILAGKWDAIADTMWQRLASAVRYQGAEWQVASTANYKAVQGWCLMAQSEGMSLALSHDAGAGKTFALVQYAETHKHAYYIQCAEYWTKKLFLANIYRALGKDPAQLTTPELADGIIETLRAQDRPLLILDEVDKLRDPLLMFFIELYNRLDGVCGFFLSGAPYLALAWEKGAKRDKRGFREIYSRIGRRFLRMNKVSRKDVQLICNANGVQDEGHINAIWNEVETQPDLRRVKREVVKLQLSKQPFNTAA
jgi:DNA transposition AAA+ family ATPase